MVLWYYNFTQLNLWSLNGPYDKTVCTKKCYERGKKAFNQNPTGNLDWTADGQTDVNGPITLETINVDWLANEGNYLGYCGDSVEKSKAAIAKENLPDFLTVTHIPKKHKQANGVQKKITQFKTSYNVACKWTRAAGSDLEKGISDFIEGAC